MMNSVKERMLSRRDFFKQTAVAGAAVATASVAAAPPAMGGGHSSVVDMSHIYDENFPTYFGVSGFARDQQAHFDEHGFNLMNLTINEHTGTHVDAPLHFSKDGYSVDEIPLETLVVPLCVVDISVKAQDNHDAQITPEDIRAWIATNGEIPDQACIAMHSGWASKTGGLDYRNVDDDGVMHFPGFHAEAAQMLLEETTAVSIGVDTLSLDFGQSADFATHYTWLPNNRYGIENLKSLDRLPASGATIVVGAPSHKGAPVARRASLRWSDVYCERRERRPIT